MSVHYFEHRFSPNSTAVIGASERTGSFGHIAFDAVQFASEPTLNYSPPSN
ncbi:MAG: hypothetical protein ABIO19_03015 [Burkholderiaceae bacterium]